MNYPLPNRNDPMPAPSVEMKITRLIQSDLNAQRPVTPSRIWSAIVAVDGDVAKWGKVWYRFLLTKYGIMQQSPDQTIHGPIENPWEPRRGTYYKPEQVKVIRLGDVAHGGIYVAQIRSHSYESYRLISPPVDSYDSAFDMALNNEGSPMATRDGFALFNKN